MILLRDITKRYGPTTVVDHLSLEVRAGTIFGLFGPNGAGKSTTIRMMTGLLPPDSGEIWIGGVSVSQDALAVKRMIGVVPDNLALFEYLTIWEHLDLAGALFDLSEDVRRKRGEQLLELLELFVDGGQLIRNASYGMRKKTALAMALISNPSVLILDEPFEGLDPVISFTVKEGLKRAASRGTTIFLTTHVLESIDDLVNQYGIIRHGALIAKGLTKNLATEGVTLLQAYLKEFEQHSSEHLAWLG